MMNNNIDYYIYILSYKRADKLYTYKTLIDGKVPKDKIFIVVGNDDDSSPYYNNFGKDNVIIFDKKQYMETTDTIDNFNKTNAVVYARNAVFDIAKKNKHKYIVVLDDDYTYISYRVPDGEHLRGYKCLNIDKIFKACINYLANTPALTCFALAQNGDFIGGMETFIKNNFKRKVMNCYFFDTDKPLNFVGSLNEDLTTSILYGSMGMCCFTVNDVSIKQNATQSNSGGLTELYLNMGTYVKSFYSVIACPSSVKCKIMPSKFSRIHHSVKWDLAVPKIISKKWKK